MLKTLFKGRIVTDLGIFFKHNPVYYYAHSFRTKGFQKIRWAIRLSLDGSADGLITGRWNGWNLSTISVQWIWLKQPWFVSNGAYVSYDEIPMDVLYIFAPSIWTTGTVTIFLIMSVQLAQRYDRTSIICEKFTVLTLRSCFGGNKRYELAALRVLTYKSEQNQGKEWNLLSS